MSKNIIFANYFEENLISIKKIIKLNLKNRNVNVENLLDNLAPTEGKMVRAILVLIGASFYKTDKEKSLHIAAAVELLHLATLVHDDIIDDSNIRRGKETINSAYGAKSALFLGDYLFAEAYVLFSKFASRSSITNTSNTIKFICSSEIDQFSSKYQLNGKVLNYFKRINGKCASLFSLSLCLAATDEQMTEALAKKLRRIGFYIGMAFQLMDDILDITSPKNILGKPTGNDIAEGIYTLPVILEFRNKNEKLLNAIKDNNFSLSLDILKTSPGFEKTKEIAKKYSFKALSLIETLPDIEEKFILKNIVQVLVVRDF